MDVEVAVKVIEEDLGRRAGGREVAAGAEARGEAVEARDEGVYGERDRGVGDERVVLGRDAERGAGEVRAAADGDAAPRAHPGEPPHLRHEPLPRRPGVRGGHSHGVEGVVQHQPRARGLLPRTAPLLLHGRRPGPDEPDGGGAPPAATTAGTAAESGGGRGRPRRRAAHGGEGEVRFTGSGPGARWRRKPRLGDGEAASLCCCVVYIRV